MELQEMYDNVIKTHDKTNNLEDKIKKILYKIRSLRDDFENLATQIKYLKNQQENAKDSLYINIGNGRRDVYGLCVKGDIKREMIYYQSEMLKTIYDSYNQAYKEYLYELIEIFTSKED